MKKSICLALAPLAFHLATAQTGIATFEVAAVRNTLPIPLQVPLDDITSIADSTLALIETTDGANAPASFQVLNGPVRQLHWILSPSPTAKKRTFRLASLKTAADQQPAMTFEKTSGALVLKAAGKNLLQYNFATVQPPAGVDPAYARSGFIHPLWSPRGQVLTRIQPKDHYHHYGIWNPWTHMLYKGDTLDLWNLYKKQGTVKFTALTSALAGNAFSEYTAHHEHVAFRNGAEEVIINELQTVRIYKPETAEHYIVDMRIELTCPADPVTLLEYRYGGLGWRTTEDWTKDNSTVLTSQGKTRKDADGSKARWCLVQGAVGGDHAGMLMMSYPTNYNHPEPLRIWPENQYNRGDMFANFSPTKDRDWVLKPGNKHVLKYRFVVFNGQFSREAAEEAWQQFANPPRVTWKAAAK